MTQTSMRYLIEKVRSVRYDKLKYKLQTNIPPALTGWILSLRFIFNPVSGLQQSPQNA